jgi:hypothetical protein
LKGSVINTPLGFSSLQLVFSIEYQALSKKYLALKIKYKVFRAINRARLIDRSFFIEDDFLSEAGFSEL